jgi:hypothetical protein
LLLFDRELDIDLVTAIVEWLLVLIAFYHAVKLHHFIAYFIVYAVDFFCKVSMLATYFAQQ